MNKKLLFTLMGMLGGILIAEVYLRYFTYKEINRTWDCYLPDRTMYMVYKPNTSCLNRRYQEYDTVPKINNVGLRSDSNTTWEKPAGVKRMLILGDSLVAAHEVEEEETFVKLLENKLKQEGKYYEVLNGGIRGYSPLLSRFYLKYQGLKLAPDIVMLVINTGDIVDDHRYLKYVKLDETTGEYVSVYPNWGFYWPAMNPDKPAQEKRNFKLSSAVVNLIKANIGAISRQWLKFPVLAEDFVLGDWRTDTLAAERESINPGSFKELMHATQDNITAIKSLTQSSGAKFYLVLSPMGHEVSKNEWDLGRKGWGAQRGKLYPTKALDDIGNWAGEIGIEVINLKAYLQQPSGGGKFFPKDGHLTPLGHEIVFEGLWAELEQRIN